MTRTTTPTTRNPLVGDPAEAAIRGMVATIVREARPRPLAVILCGSRGATTAPLATSVYANDPCDNGPCRRREVASDKRGLSVNGR